MPNNCLPCAMCILATLASDAAASVWHYSRCLHNLRNNRFPCDRRMHWPARMLRMSGTPTMESATKTKSAQNQQQTMVMMMRRRNDDDDE